MVITYQQATERYNTQRKHLPLGIKYTSKIWMDYDTANDRYVLAYTKSKYFDIKDSLDNTITVKARPWHREKYTQKTIGYIYRDCAHIFPDRAARNFYVEWFNCVFRKSTSLKVKGFEWEINRAKILSGDGLYVYPDGRHEADTPYKIRVHNKEKQKALNAQLKAVSRMILLRIKLGAFHDIDWQKVDGKMQVKYGNPCWTVLRNPADLNRLFEAVSDEDYLTMLPILWLAAITGALRFDMSNTSTYDWAKEFKRFIASCREKLRNAQGAVDYVVDTSNCSAITGPA